EGGRDAGAQGPAAGDESAPAGRAFGHHPAIGELHTRGGDGVDVWSGRRIERIRVERSQLIDADVVEDDEEDIWRLALRRRKIAGGGPEQHERGDEARIDEPNRELGSLHEMDLLLK